MAEITIRRLLQAGVHFGHQTRYWSPKMAPYIFGDRNKIHIINLEKTLPMLKEATNFLGTIAARGGKILFVGTKRQAGRQVREAAIACGAMYVDYRWLGGMLTNFKTVKNSINRLKDIEQRIESGAAARLSKKEALTIERERAKLDKTLSGIKNMGGLPDAIFVIDVEEEYIAVAEANKLGIPVVAVVDSNCSLNGIDYVIPGNDDSSRAISLYLEAVSEAILASRAPVKIVASSETSDEYIELDDKGAIIATIPDVAPKAEAEVAAEPAAPAEAAVEVAATETVAVAAEAPAEAAEAPAVAVAVEAAEAAAEPAAAEEAVVARKVSKKKVVRKKAAASEE